MALGLQNIPLLKLAFALIIGLIIANRFVIELSLVFGVILFVCFILLTYHFSSAPLIKSACLLIAFVAIGLLEFSTSQIEFNQTHYNHFKNPKFIIYQVNKVETAKHGYKLQSSINYIGNNKDSLFATDGKILVFQKDLPKPEIGAIYLSTSTTFPIKPNTNPHAFDYSEYLAKLDIYKQVFCDSTNTIKLSDPNINLSFIISKIRNRAIDILEGHIKQKDQLAIAQAMLLGQRDLLSEDLTKAYADTGAVHVLAVSGLHVGIVSTLILMLFKRIKRKTKLLKLIELIISLSAVWMFAFITGAAPAVIRAAVMFSFLLLGRTIYRNSNSLNILALAAILMIFYNPKLIFQVGFQFSFLALAGILIFYPLLKNMLNFSNPVLRWIWELSIVSISAQLLVAPLVIYYFHKLPLYFIISGLIAIPAAFGIIYLGLLLLIAQLCFGDTFILTSLCAEILSWLLHYFIEGILFIQHLPFCSLNDLWISNVSLVLIYAAVACFALALRFKRPRLYLAAALLLILQISTQLWEDHQLRKQDKIFVYDIYKESLMHIMHDGYVATLSTLNIEDSKIKYSSYNNLLYQRKIENCSLKELGVEVQDEFLLAGDKLIMYAPTKDCLGIKRSRPVDLLILNKNSYNKLEELAMNGPIKNIILDNSIGKDKYKLIKTADKLGIPIYDISTAGAYETNW